MNDSQSRKIKGFTLIELMIVVAIIGILGVLALYAYQIYTKRTHMAEGLSMASALKATVSDYYATHGTWPANNFAAGSPSIISGNAVKSIVVDGATLRITYNAKVVDDAQLLLIASDQNGSIGWVCRSSTGAGAVVPAQYLPERCR